MTRARFIHQHPSLTQTHSIIMLCFEQLNALEQFNSADNNPASFAQSISNTVELFENKPVTLENIQLYLEFARLAQQAINAYAEHTNPTYKELPPLENASPTPSTYCESSVTLFNHNSRSSEMAQQHLAEQRRQNMNNGRNT